MIKGRTDFNSNNIFNICVDDIKDGEISGRIYHCYSNENIVFIGISTIFIVMEDVFNKIKYPQASTQCRNFTIKKSGNNISEKEEKVSKRMATGEVNDQIGNKGTFVVHVQCRQNSTWQGSVLWGEKNITKQFRSALELIKLIDSALNDEGEVLEKEVKF